MSEPTKIPDDAYVAFSQMGRCKRCGEYADLRCGACFHCSSRIDGRPLPGGGHELWDQDNPANRWTVEVPN